jgi:peroxin-6
MGAVMNHIVSQLLAKLEGISFATSSSSSGGGGGSKDLFITYLANRLDSLGPALLRPKRLDRLPYLDVSDTDEAQLHILQVFSGSSVFIPRWIACPSPVRPFNLIGTDFFALCADTLLD